MNRVFIFDVDGTLTPSRRPMTDDFEMFFSRWAKENTFYLVSGSDLEKIQEQVPEYILELASGVFTCGGNKFYIDDKLQYENKFELPKHLEDFLNIMLTNSEYPYRYGNHIENRGAMVNFSIVGRDCTLEQRLDYFEYDNKTKERQRIANIIKSKVKGIDAVIGGQISIDIAPVGNDKSQIFKHIEEIENFNCPDEYIFIGDRTMEGGNDYPLAKVMDELQSCDFYQAGEPSAEDGYKRTKQILESLID
jgi:phosphomannomutase